MNTLSINEQLEVFLRKLSGEMHRYGIVLDDHWAIDHICYRTATWDSYETLKKELLERSTLLVESMVNGRPICTFRLNQPILLLGRKIFLLELPAPKAAHLYSDGFEHIEIVCDLSFGDIVSRFSNCQFSWSGANKTFNAELEVILKDYAIKFHHQSLGSVVTLEQNQTAFAVLNRSCLMEKLKGMQLFIAGTFPLALDVKGSDIDVLVSTADTKRLAEELHRNFGHCQDYSVSHFRDSGYDTSIASFVYDDLTIEIYASEQPLFQQSAFRHFRVEERLLGLGGPEFYRKLRKFRDHGYKTEAAFAKALGLPGDPFDAIDQLYSLSESSLEELLQRSEELPSLH